MADDPGSPAYSLQAFVFGSEGIEHRIDIRLRPSSLGFPQQLAEQRLVIRWKGVVNLTQAVTLRQRRDRT